MPPPPKPAIFLHECLMAARLEEGCYEEHFFMCFLVCKGLSNNEVGGWQGAPYFRRYGRELVSKQAISLKIRWGGLS